jgi:hypothetical protein
VTKSQVLLIGNESVGEEGRIGCVMGEDVLYTGHSKQECQEELVSCALARQACLGLGCKRRRDGDWMKAEVKAGERKITAQSIQVQFQFRGEGRCGMQEPAAHGQQDDLGKLGPSVACWPCWESGSLGPATRIGRPSNFPGLSGEGGGPLDRMKIRRRTSHLTER